MKFKIMSSAVLSSSSSLVFSPQAGSWHPLSPSLPIPSHPFHFCIRTSRAFFVPERTGTPFRHLFLVPERAFRHLFQRLENFVQKLRKSKSVNDPRLSK